MDRQPRQPNGRAFCRAQPRPRRQQRPAPPPGRTSVSAGGGGSSLSGSGSRANASSEALRGERPVSAGPAAAGPARPRRSPLPAVLQAPLAAPLRHAQQLLLDLPQVREVAAPQPRGRHPAVCLPPITAPHTERASAL